MEAKINDNEEIWLSNENFVTRLLGWTPFEAVLKRFQTGYSHCRSSARSSKSFKQEVKNSTGSALGRNIEHQLEINQCDSFPLKVAQALKSGPNSDPM